MIELRNRKCYINNNLNSKLLISCEQSNSTSLSRNTVPLHRHINYSLENASVNVGAGICGLMATVCGVLKSPNKPHILIEKRNYSNISDRNQIIALTNESVKILKQIIIESGLKPKEVFTPKLRKLKSHELIDENTHEFYETKLCERSNNRYFAKAIAEHNCFIKIGELQDTLLEVVKKLQKSGRDLSIIDEHEFIKVATDEQEDVFLLKSLCSDSNQYIKPSFSCNMTGKPKILTSNKEADYNPYKQSSKLQSMDLIVLQMKVRAEAKDLNIEQKSCFITEGNIHGFDENNSNDRLFLAVLNVDDEEDNKKFTRYQFNIQLPTGNSPIYSPNKNDDMQSIILDSINSYFNTYYSSLSQVSKDFEALPLFKSSVKENTELKQYGDILTYALRIDAHNHKSTSPILADNNCEGGDNFIASTPLGAFGANACITKYGPAIADMEKARFDYQDKKISLETFRNAQKNFSERMYEGGNEWLDRSSRTMKQY